jgi:DNA-binding IscR family transcriptional regulator
MLIKEPHEVPLSEIMGPIDSSFAPLPCLSRRVYQKCHDCPDKEACLLRQVFGQVFWCYLLLIESLTLADLIPQPESSKSGALARQIGI